MSSPIHDGSISPNDPSYYAPRRSGVEAKTPLPDRLSSPSALATTDSGSARTEDAEVIVPFPRAREYLNVFDHGTRKTWRTKALVVSAIAAALTGGIAFFGFVSFAPRVSEKQTQQPELSLATRLQTAAVDIQKAAQRVVTPTLVVNESAGEMNAPLALGLEVKNYSPGAVIALSDFPAGTSISSGAAEGDRHWRIAVEELPNAKVTPPSGYIGVMTILAELRIGKDIPIVRSPVRLIWRALPSPASPAPGPSSAPEPSPPRTTAVDQPVRHLDARESASLLRRAEEMKAAGDLAAARLLLQRVAETNNARAAFELAETYDPIAIKKAGGSSVTADAALAQHWYQRAREWGHPSGSQELDAIASRAAASPK
ncbi:MAG TPA: hypothetical protein VFL49_00025 [Pseudolabrys sp.]|nr:hypothetical protein [Pseudolabrys sp.]